MWPFDKFRARRYQRNYNAALIIFLGAHMSAYLDGEQKARVASRLREILKRSPLPAAAFWRLAPWDLVAAVQAVAMQQAGVKPVVNGITWSQLYGPWKVSHKLSTGLFSFLGFDDWSGFNIYDYRPFAKATADAKEFLRLSGMELPDADPLNLGSLDSLEGPDRFLQESGLRAYWEKKQ